VASGKRLNVGGYRQLSVAAWRGESEITSAAYRQMARNDMVCNQLIVSSAAAA